MEVNRSTQRCQVTNSQNSDCASEGNSIDIGEIIETQDVALMSTSAVLFYCKSKILYPYLKFLSFMGLRLTSLDHANNSRCSSILSHFHTILVATFICLGYVIQYMSCFRRDRGFSYGNATLIGIKFNNTDFYDNCGDGTLFNSIIPSGLHFTGYMYAIYLFRISDNEYLHNLMERVFLSSSFSPQNVPYANPKKLLKILWMYLIASLIWATLSFTTVYITVMKTSMTFKWMDESSERAQTAITILLVLCTLIQDLVQSTVIANYCLQAQLLKAHLYYLKNRLLNRTISPLDWMRETTEFKKLLQHLNIKTAPCTCLFVTVDLCWSLSGLVWMANYDNKEAYNDPVTLLRVTNEILWIFASIAPFVSAARLTAACSLARDIGHEMIARPFPHRETPQQDLNAVLSYASTLRLSADLFGLPVTGRRLCFAGVTAGITVIVLGMCHYVYV